MNESMNEYDERMNAQQMRCVVDFVRASLRLYTHIYEYTHRHTKMRISVAFLLPTRIMSQKAWR